MANPMNWKTIRLELGSTPAHPRGSASRAYLLRLPLNDVGQIDDQALASHPEQATVSRFWPCEPDKTGTIEKRGIGLELRCEDARAKVFTSRLQSSALTLGSEVYIEEPSGSRMPFRVAGVRSLA
jgi:hypothetical protein